MRGRLLWNRRDFMEMVGWSSLGAISAHLTCLSVSGKANSEAEPRFVYVGFAGNGLRGSGHGIGVFAVEGERWKPTGVVASDHPSSLTLHPSESFLYAIQEVDRYENLPTGVVEAYAIDEKDGSLALLNRQALSLSATAPRHVAVSPDGRALVVAVHGGGAYNVLPINEDGTLGRVSGILKETGSGPNEEHQQTAHPQMVIFDKTGGRLLGADLGSDRLSVFTLGEGRLNVVQRSEVREGSGPRQIEFHPEGHLLFVANELDTSVSCYRYDAGEGKILARVEHVSMNHGEKAAVMMTMHPSGRFLYTADRSGTSGVTVWRVDAKTGALRPIQFESEELLPLHSMMMVAHGGSLLAVSQKRGSVIRWSVDCASGRLSRPVQMAKVPAPMSLAVKYL